MPDGGHYDTNLYFTPVSCLELRVCIRKKNYPVNNITLQPILMANTDSASEDSWEKSLEGEAGCFLLELAFAVKSRMKYSSLHAVIKLACCPTLIITTVTGPDLFWV